MTKEEMFQYWLAYAQNDLDTADAMFTSCRYIYVYFTCQQALEKLVKGFYVLFVDDNVPKVHDISALIGKFKDKLKNPIKPDYLALFDTLSNFYLRSRYPDYSKALFNMATKENSSIILQKTKEIWQWLLTMKP